MDSRTERPCRCSCVLESLSDTGTVTVAPHITGVGMDTCYSCKSKQTLEDESVNQTLWNVLIQAFVSNNSKSEVRKCGCSAVFHPALTFLCCLHCLSALSTQLAFVLLMSLQPLPPPPLMPRVLQLELLSPTLLPPPLLLPPPQPPPSPHPPLGTTASSLMKTARPVC